MTKQEANQQYDAARTLCGRGEYAEALSLLEQLTRLFPNEADYLYAQAQCLRNMGRLDEARWLCEKLEVVFSDPRAAQLRSQLGPGESKQEPSVSSNKRRGGRWRLLLGLIVALLCLVTAVSTAVRLVPPAVGAAGILAFLAAGITLDILLLAKTIVASPGGNRLLSLVDRVFAQRSQGQAITVSAALLVTLVAYFAMAPGKTPPPPAPPADAVVAAPASEVPPAPPVPDEPPPPAPDAPAPAPAAMAEVKPEGPWTPTSPPATYGALMTRAPKPSGETGWDYAGYGRPGKPLPENVDLTLYARSTLAFDLMKNPHLKRLVLDRSVWADTDWARLGGFVQVEDLTMRNCRIPVASFDALKEMKSLRSVRIGGCEWIQEDGMSSATMPATAWATLASLEGLRVLDVGNVIFEEGTDLPFERLTHLEELDLGGTINERSFPDKLPLDTISLLAELQTLFLYETDLTMWDPAPLSTLRELGFIHLGRSKLGPNTLAALAKLPNLTCVNLNRAEVNEEDYETFKAAKPKCEILADGTRFVWCMEFPEDRSAGTLENGDGSVAMQGALRVTASPLAVDVPGESLPDLALLEQIPPKALRAIKIHDGILSSEQLKVLNRFDNMRLVVLERVELGDADLFPVLAGIHGLFALELREQALPEPTFAGLGAVNGINLLSLDKCTIPQAGWEAIQQLTDLQQIEVSRIQPVTPFFGAAPALSDLRRVRLAAGGELGAELAALKDIIPLRALDLTGCTFSDAGASALCTLNQVINLNLSDTNLTDSHVAALARLEYLYELDLTGTPITGDALGAFKGHENLHRLSLARIPGFVPANLQHLAGIPKLSGLSLKRLNLKDGDLANLAGLTTLRSYLTLSGNPLTDKSVPDIAACINNNRKDCARLQEVYLLGVPLTVTGLVDLLKNRPEDQCATRPTKILLDIAAADDEALRGQTSGQNCHAFGVLTETAPAQSLEERLAASKGVRDSVSGLKRVIALPLDPHLVRVRKYPGGSLNMTHVEIPPEGQIQISPNLFRWGEDSAEQFACLSPDDVMGINVWDDGAPACDSAKVVEAMSFLLGRFTRVKSFRMDFCRVWSPELSKAVAGLPDLQDFYLAAELTDNDLAALSSALSGSKQVKLSLRLVPSSRGTITAKGLASLRNVAAVVSLDLRLLPLQDSDLASLANAKGLETLSLSGSRLSDAGLAHLGRLNAGALYLGNTGLADQGLHAISRMSSVQYLDVSGTGVTDACVADLVRMGANYRKRDWRVPTLWIGNTLLSQKARNALQNYWQVQDVRSGGQSAPKVPPAREFVFPDEALMAGEVHTADWGVESPDKWDRKGIARGTVRVGEGRAVKIIVFGRDLSFLDNLKSNDVQVIDLRDPKVTAETLTVVKRFSGLHELILPQFAEIPKETIERLQEELPLCEIHN